MKLKYLGHSAFELRLEDGRKIVFDPYEPGSYGGSVGFGPIEGVYDFAVVSHDHPDHRWEKITSTAGRVIDKEGEIVLEGVKFTSLPSYHDESGGSERGRNLISIVEAEGIKLAHLGDLGHTISLDEYANLKGLDVILIPIGGFFTIDVRVAASIIKNVQPGLVIPMHFKTDKLGFPIAPVEDFTKLMDNVEFSGSSEIEITKDSLPSETRVVVLDPAL
ncbi:MAG: MBL fold metallo-hydrolase [Candidatus Krumholzibacteriota bacterium]|nr:MBL fold metallo-hydrolase [Candidatus Krumholzibacteriota bacterium]